MGRHEGRSGGGAANFQCESRQKRSGQSSEILRRVPKGRTCRLDDTRKEVLTASWQKEGFLTPSAQQNRGVRTVKVLVEVPQESSGPPGEIGTQAVRPIVTDAVNRDTRGAARHCAARGSLERGANCSYSSAM